MYQSTRGIVFHQVKYSDSSLVVKILTEEAGLGSFIIKGARGPKSKMKSSLFQPLNLLDLVVSFKEKSELNYLKEVRVSHFYKTIPGDIRKSSIILFLNELLYKTIREEAVNPELFHFIYNNLVLLDETEENPANFHLLFAIHLTHFLGIFPQGDYRNEQTVFDLEEGSFSQAEPLPAANFISGSLCSWFSKLLTVPVENFYTLSIPGHVRNEILEKVLAYYHIHLPLTGVFKSHLILHEVLQK